jgi:hypothetical protein
MVLSSVSKRQIELMHVYITVRNWFEEENNTIPGIRSSR